MASAEFHLAIAHDLTWRELAEFAALGNELGVDPDETFLLHHDERDELQGISFIVPAERVAAKAGS